MTHKIARIKSFCEWVIKIENGNVRSSSQNYLCDFQNMYTPTAFGNARFLRYLAVLGTPAQLLLDPDLQVCFSHSILLWGSKCAIYSKPQTRQTCLQCRETCSTSRQGRATPWKKIKNVHTWKKTGIPHYPSAKTAWPVASENLVVRAINDERLCSTKECMLLSFGLRIHLVILAHQRTPGEQAPLLLALNSPGLKQKRHSVVYDRIHLKKNNNQE